VLYKVSSIFSHSYNTIHRTFYPNLCPQTYVTVRTVVTITFGIGTTQSLIRLPIWLYWVWFPDRSLRVIFFQKHPIRLRGSPSVVFDAKLPAGCKAAGAWIWPINSVLLPSHESIELCVCLHDFRCYNFSFVFITQWRVSTLGWRR
jgi:hypothetical protein